MNAAGVPALQEPALLVIQPSGGRSRQKLSPLPFTIGRQAGNHLVLRDSRASRNHARIVLENGVYYLEDLKSRNGVTVNQKKVQGRRALASGDEIEFGVENSYRLVFTLEESEILKLMGQLQTPAAAGVPGSLAKLRALVDVARTVQSAFSTDYVLSAVVDAALTVTGADRGFLLLEEGGGLTVAVARDCEGMTLEAAELGVDTGGIRKMLDTHIGFAPPLPESQNILCVPLVRMRPHSSEETVALSQLRQTLGALYLESGTGGRALSAGDRELLETLALEASAILENARLLEQERLRQKMENELNIARQIQQSLMPRHLPREGWFRAAAVNIPTHKVGGDYCDVAHIGSDTWGFIIADVSGKGVSSALLAALLQGAFFAGGHAATRMDELMSQVNRFLTERTQGEKYATLFGAVVSRDGSLRWTNAGHCPALLLRASGALESLEPTSMPIGMLDEAEFEVRETRLEPGDKILAYTDGVTDAQGRDRRHFGTRRVEELARSSRHLSCPDLLAALVKAVDDFNEGTEQEDDITAVAVEYAG